ncbi:4-(cytidine 5'-diphospho)-2-C-methyl-D-erythritol kinase [Taibaiella chishuiensis]|uniref:4-diphosphocytidyl-2-C-methyl-D-erythritol kinase n=1 Tax=Taibaiella chishuiensis TaxID=1434707 RepID=A0A2P8DB99_9BACT|nr:4-(cytidine 5'-diphospho)-2-C-methyl-D-erythritol kinase [Taibaiella chishuiensis]PSK94506.1 4-diphosphocytidyl-2-C-methyl-D-erythritol kinase [Taibaiella chishuiensis]
MLSFPNAKINFGLYVTRKRDDGYHDLETFFYPVPYCDALEILPAGNSGGTMALTGLPVAGDTEKNLVWKAYQLLLREYPGQVKPLDIHLHKVIPMGAGMGGGSADAAFMLDMMNTHFGLGIDKETLGAYALELGSDCPFFLLNKPAFAGGRGERLEPVALDLSAYSIQIVCPSIHVGTADAFRNIVPAPAGFDLRQLATLRPEDWRGRIANDFEVPVFKLHPVLQTIKDQLYAGGAVYASMSGSGSSLYGIFPKGQRAVLDLPIVCSEHYCA